MFWPIGLGGMTHSPKGYNPNLWVDYTPKIYLKVEDGQGLPNRKIVSNI